MLFKTKTAVITAKKDAIFFFCVFRTVPEGIVKFFKSGKKEVNIFIIEYPLSVEQTEKQEFLYQ